MTRVRKLFSAGIMVVLIFPVSVLCAPDQAGRSNYDPQRNAWGNPDIQGVWDFRTLTPLERPLSVANKSVFSAEEARVFLDQAIRRNDVDSLRELPAVFDVEGAYNSFWYDFGTELNEDLRTSLIVEPKNGRLPDVTPAALARMKEQNRLRLPPVRDLFSFGANPSTFRPEGPESLGLSERCLVGLNAGPPLNPSAYNNNLRIIQTPGYVVLFTEMIHDARIVLMDGRPHLPTEIRKWSGDSRGHWEGNTLVIETTNFTDKTPIFQLPVQLDSLSDSGSVGSGTDLHLIERFTPVSESRLVYEYRIDEPGTFTEPFTVVIPMRASDDRMFEYACHEGNYALPGILRGARLLEKEDAKTALLETTQAASN